MNSFFIFMNQLQYKNLILDLDKITCKIENKELYLTHYEYQLLKYFLENKNKIFNRQELINVIWEKKVSLRTIDTTISRLRKKLGEYSKYIKTRSQFGYGWITE